MTNDHVNEAIDSYLDAETLPVPHAILISGAWGSGKTFFLKEIYEPRRTRERQKLSLKHTPFLYVSLFGATSAADAELRIYKTANPGEAIVGVVAGTITLGIAEFLRMKDTAKGAVDKLGKRAIKRLNEYVFVFDDLERVEPTALLEVIALINSFVAEHNKRVILVADEEVILRDPDMAKVWIDQREKVVGRRAKIEPDFARVLATSLKEHPLSPATELALEIEGSLLEVVRLSAAQNLRSLKWALHNSIALGNVLATDPDIPRSHIIETIKIVMASSLWLRSGFISKVGLHRVPEVESEIAFRKLSQKGDNPEDPDLRNAQSFLKAYVSLEVQRPPIKYEYITAFEESGSIDTTSLLEWVKSQFGFGANHQEPAWRRLWYAFDRRTTEIDMAVDELAAELAAFQHIQLGVILHVVGLCLRHERASDLRITGGITTKDFFIGYIDSLLERGSLPTIPENDFYGHDESHDGLGFTERSTEEFRDISNYVFDNCNEAFRRSLKVQAARIFERAAAGDTNALFAFVQLDTDLGKRPVLSEFPPEEFAEIVTADFPQLRVGARILAYRYHHKHPPDPILTEIPWAKKTLAAIRERISTWRHPYHELGAKSLEGIIRHYEKDRDAAHRILD